MDNEYKDMWEEIQEYVNNLGYSTAHVAIALIFAFFWAYMPAVVINMFFPRVELSFFHSALITLSIGLPILVIVWWKHKNPKKNE